MPYYKHHKHKGPHQCVCVIRLLVTACLITHITNIRALTSVCVCAFMPYHITLVTACLITHITNIRALTNVCAFMPYHIILLIVCLITNIKHKGTHHCV